MFEEETGKIAAKPDANPEDDGSELQTKSVCTVSDDTIASCRDDSSSAPEQAEVSDKKEDDISSAPEQADDKLVSDTKELEISSRPEEAEDKLDSDTKEVETGLAPAHEGDLAQELGLIRLIC